MPPVFGPVSSSPTRLKSCAGSSGTTVRPSTRQNSDASGPSRNDSSTTGCPPSSSISACLRARSTSVVTTTPLPAASPSSLTTQVGPNRARAASRCAGLSTTSLRAVGTPAAFITSLANALDPSIRAAAALGPKQAIPSARTASAAPATSGTSGPITTRSARQDTASPAIAAGSVRSTPSVSATAAVPGLPGAQPRAVTAGSCEAARARACSRAPEPITRTRTRTG